MTISFHEASVGTYLQILNGASGVLEKGLNYFSENGIDPQSIVDARVASDMLPFSFQVHAISHHSLGALEGMKSGVFKPPGPKEPHSYEQLQATVTNTIAALKALSRDEVNALEGKDVVFEMRGMKMPFTTNGFLFSFSLPNFYFHATTAYDILRSKGAPLGKRDFMGSMRMKS
jgi:hypothetical protein